MCLVLQGLTYTQIKIPIVFNLGGILLLSNDKEHFCTYLKILVKGVPSAESSRSVLGMGKGVSGKRYPRLCNARRPHLS